MTKLWLGLDMLNIKTMLNRNWRHLYVKEIENKLVLTLVVRGDNEQNKSSNKPFDTWNLNLKLKNILYMNFKTYYKTLIYDIF